MVMSWIWTGILALSFVCAMALGRISQLTGAIMEGAQAGVTLAIAMAGSICLWSGVGKLLEKSGLSHRISRLLQPVLKRIFPATKTDPVLAGYLSANICANLLGLGNAATPMGIAAAKRLRDPNRPDFATDQLCRLIVLNTASIQLIPTNVAAVRLSLGCASPFDILPAVWIASVASAGLGLTAAAALGRIWRL